MKKTIGEKRANSRRTVASPSFKNGEKVNPDEKTVIDMRATLSTLWIFAVLNYLYCDVVALMDPALLKQFMAGSVGGLQMTQGFLLGASILMEIPISMVLLSRTLSYEANRRANITAGMIMTVVQFSSLFYGSSPTNYYIFFSIVEIASTSLIVWYAWTWRPEA